MFKYGMNGKASFLPSRALEIYVMIQDLIDRAIKIRHQDSSSINTEWFSAESQLKIRQQVCMNKVTWKCCHCGILI